MAVKPNALPWTILEQIVEDPASGVTLQFSVTSGGEFRLTLTGNLPFGNRDFVFGKDGRLEGAGTGVAGPCPPSWIRPVED